MNLFFILVVLIFIMLPSLTYIPRLRAETFQVPIFGPEGPVSVAGNLEKAALGFRVFFLSYGSGLFRSRLAHGGLGFGV